MILVFVLELLVKGKNVVQLLDCGQTVVRLQDLQLQGCGSESPKLTADFTMTRISIANQLLNHNFLICVIHNHRWSLTNVCMREIGCCQLRVYIPLWEFAEFP